MLLRRLANSAMANGTSLNSRQQPLGGQFQARSGWQMIIDPTQRRFSTRALRVWCLQKRDSKVWLFFADIGPNCRRNVVPCPFAQTYHLGAQTNHRRSHFVGLELRDRLVDVPRIARAQAAVKNHNLMGPTPRRRREGQTGRSMCGQHKF